MSNNHYFLPSLDLGFQSRLETIMQIVTGQLAHFPDGAIWRIDSLFVDGNAITSRRATGAFGLRYHIEWLESHIAKRPAYTPIELPSKSLYKEERLQVIDRVSGHDSFGNGVIVFDEGEVSYNNCRVVGDQIVTAWERGTGYRIETELSWLRGQIEWKERQAARLAFQPKKPSSIHPGRQSMTQRLSDDEPKVVAATKPVVTPKPPVLNTGKAAQIGQQFLVEKRNSLRQQIEAQIQTAIENDDNVTFEMLSGEIDSRVAKVALSDAEILEINRKVEIEEREARRRDPNFGATKMVAKTAKVDKKNGKPGKRRAA